MSKHLFLFVLLMATLPVLATRKSVPELHLTIPSALTDSAKQENRYWTVKRDLSLTSVPYLTLGLVAHAIKRDVRKINHDINWGFHNKVDDYLQFAPLALTYGLKATGYQGRSQWGRLLTSNAFSAVIMAAMVNGLKYSVRDTRPDGTADNSFPSGHTATAFMAATILHKEYGLTRSLWYSVGGYSVATGIGAFRVMNNRHWVSDVLVGAGIGILSTELGYAISDIIFKDKYTMRREMENLNDVSEHPSFFSLQAGIGIMLGKRDVPQELTAIGGPSRIKHGLSTVIAAEAAYFLNPYMGLGLRARINSTAVMPSWEGGSDVWTSGMMHFNPATNSFEHPNPLDVNYKRSDETRTDQLSSFDVMGGIYGQLPLSKRMSLGTKALFGRRHSGDVWFWADKSGKHHTENEDYTQTILAEMTTKKSDINTYDRVKSFEMEGDNSFIFGTSINFSYALKHNIVWRVFVDYDFTRANYNYNYYSFSLAEEANNILNPGGNIAAWRKTASGSLRRKVHQITPGFAVCFSF
jgi:hypothetical protein